MALAPSTGPGGRHRTGGGSFAAHPVGQQGSCAPSRYVGLGYPHLVEEAAIKQGYGQSHKEPGPCPSVNLILP